MKNICQVSASNIGNYLYASDTGLYLHKIYSLVSFHTSIDQSLRSIGAHNDK